MTVYFVLPKLEEVDPSLLLEPASAVESLWQCTLRRAGAGGHVFGGRCGVFHLIQRTPNAHRYECMHTNCAVRVGQAANLSRHNLPPHVPGSTVFTAGKDFSAAVIPT